MSRLAAITALVFLATGCGALVHAQEPSPEKLNIVFILTDDLDAELLNTHLGAYPNLKSLAQQGTTFSNAFVSNSLCCPSRSTILTGLYSHNHRVMHNKPPEGGAPAFHDTREPRALPVWLNRQGYETGYLGKYMNGYDGSWVPSGWDEWQGVTANNTALVVGSEGDPLTTKAAPAPKHLNEVLSDKANSFIGRNAGPGGPFFLQVSTSSPHKPASYAERHAGLFTEARAPLPSSFDEVDASDKPRWLREWPRLTAKDKTYIDELYRNRLRSMMGVDEMVGRLTATLEEKGELENTYFVFASDNSYHMGHHRLVEGKRLAYEEDIRVPLIVRGPRVPEGAVRKGMVLNNDLAPTFAQWSGAQPSWVTDGRSLAPLLSYNPPTEWRSAFLVEAAPHSFYGRPAFRAVRNKNYLYVSYVSGEEELYNLNRDPYQLTSRHRYRVAAAVKPVCRLASRGSRTARTTPAGPQRTEGEVEPRWDERTAVLRAA